jgi:uncharacterized protein (DUF302 family)
MTGPTPTEPEVVGLAAEGSVDATVARLCDAARAAGLLVFARVDHGAGARDAGLELADEVALLLGSPQVGTLLMQAEPRTGLDLPLRVLVRDDAGTTRVTWSDPRRLSARYAIEGVDELLEKMQAGLRHVVEGAL